MASLGTDSLGPPPATSLESESNLGGDHMSSATVAVVGGGYGGIIAAKALEEFADVVLIEPRDTFVHHNATPRALIDPQWAEHLFLPYSGILRHGRVVRARAEKVEEQRISLDTGEQITADFIVLATGASYPYPAKFDITDRETALARLAETHSELRAASSVLVLGAGTVGLEVVGEIVSAWPDKAVTVVEPGDDVVGGRYPEPFRAEIRRQLRDLGVDLRLGTRLAETPPTTPGTLAPFSVRTSAGDTVAADIWFRCFGVAPHSDYLAGDLADARDDRGRLRVTEHLRLRGHDTVFAIGDVTDVDEPKMAAYATAQADVVVANIRALAQGDQLTAYQPADEHGVILPLGPTAGASWVPGTGLLGPAQTSEYKGKDMMLGAVVDRLSRPVGTAS